MPSNIGEKLLNIRTSRGETQEAVAEYVGISYVSLSRYENGQRMPKMDILKRLADHYGVSVDELMTNEPKPISADQPLTETERRLLFAFRAADETYQNIALELLETHQKRSSNVSAS